MPNETTIRSACGSDASSVSSLLLQANEASGGLARIPSLELLHGLVLRLIDDHVVLVADRDGWVCGVLVGQISSSILDPTRLSAFVMSWYVTPRVRGNGGGTSLLERFREIAKECGAHYMSIFLAETPDVGATIAKRLGFKPLERAYYMEV